jgi:hypothetical protein
MESQVWGNRPPALVFDLDSNRRHRHQERISGSLLLQNVANREHQCLTDRPRGWLGALSCAAAMASAAAVGADKAAQHNTSLGPHMAACSEVPVPCVYVGLLPMPILAGQHALSVEHLLHSLRQGVLPSDTLAEADRDVWRTASRITGGNLLRQSTDTNGLPPPIHPPSAP